MPQKFCHLHLHSEFSFLDGIIRIPDVAKKCKKDGMDAVALTDHGVMYGAIELIEACRKEGIKPIVGCEVYVTTDRKLRDPTTKTRNSHIVLLAMDDTGYRNLSTLVSLAYREGLYYKPRIDHELFAQYCDGLIALSGCLRGELSQCLMADLPEKARQIAGFYKDVLGPDRYYIELQDHGIADQEKINGLLVDLSRDMDLPLVATNDCHFLDANDRDIQDVMICIQTGKKLSDTNRFKAYTHNHHVKSTQEMVELFRWVPEAIDNTVKIAEMVSFNPSLNQFHFPEFTPPDGTTPEEFLRKTSHEGLSQRLNGNVSDDYRQRLDYELDVICDMGFASYLLITGDFTVWAKDRNIPVGPGRGSAAVSLVSYAIGIIDIDPLQYGLQFERFLNPARKSMPDIDIDFDPVGRADVIKYVTETYGVEHVCQIVTFNRLKARAALRDVGRVMDIPLGDVDKIAKMVPFGKDLDFTIENDEDFARAYQETALNRQWFDTAKAVEGLVRNGGVHAAGVIICGDPIWEHAPVQKIEGDIGQVCQYSMNDAEKVGLVKMDFLGLKTLTYLRQACNNIRENHGVEIDLLNIPLDDKKTFKMLSRGDVLGVFQMEGGGMRDLLMAIAPDRLEDLIATVALFRPGPMENDLHHKYARRKNGKEEITYRHELLKPILEPTYGTLTYQEQISLILQAMGDIDLASATMIMKLISKKKDRQSIAKYKEEFLKGAEAKELSRATAKELWNEMEAFAGYGFNKAHSTAYGLIAYQTAYLKANYPLEFHAAYMTNESGNQDKIAWIVDDLKSKKVQVLAPDVNESYPDFRVEGKGVRYGLAAIKGVGHLAVESIVAGRDEHGPFENFYQLAARSDLRLVNKGVFESLINAGACDTLEGNRHSMLESVADALEQGKKKQEDVARGQVGLFGAPGAGPSPSLPDLEEFSRKELLKMEKSSLGFYLSHHPLEDVKDKIQKYTREKIPDLEELRDGRTVRVGGMLGSVHKKLSRRGQNFATFKLEDMHNKVDGIIFPKTYSQYGGLLDNDAFVVIKARLRIEELESKDDESRPIKQVQLIAEEIWRYNPDSEEEWVQSKAPDEIRSDPTIAEDILLEDDVGQYMAHGSSASSATVSIVLDIDKIERTGISTMKAHLGSRKGPTPVRLKFPVNGREHVIDTGPDRHVMYSPDLREALLAINGVRDVILDQGTGT